MRLNKQPDAEIGSLRTTVPIFRRGHAAAVADTATNSSIKPVIKLKNLCLGLSVRWRCLVAVGHHTQLTNPGFSRKKVDGTMFFS